MSANETRPGGGGGRPTIEKTTTSSRPTGAAAPVAAPAATSEPGQSAVKPAVATSAPPVVPPAKAEAAHQAEAVTAKAPKAEPARSASALQPAKAAPAAVADNLAAPVTTATVPPPTPVVAAAAAASPLAPPTSPTASSARSTGTPPAGKPAAPSSKADAGSTAAVAATAEPALAKAPRGAGEPAKAPPVADTAPRAPEQPPVAVQAEPPVTKPAGPPVAVQAEPPVTKPADPPVATQAEPPFAKPAEPPKPVHVPRDKLAPDHEVNAVLSAAHGDPFAFLGMHPSWYEGPMMVRAFVPWAKGGEVVEAATGQAVARLERVRDEGFWVAVIQGRITWFGYRLRFFTDHGDVEIEDPYSFPPVLADPDVHMLAEGGHLRLWEKLGAHPATIRGIDGVAFAVWAPHASRVAVIGDFNDWDGRRHAMRRRHECGVWEIFLPGAREGAHYKFEIKSSAGAALPDKSDPVAFRTEQRPGSASVVDNPDRYRWGDAAWLARRGGFVARERPISIYEVHLGSWRRRPEEGHRSLSYQENADQLIGYVRDMGFTHVQLMPVAEHDSDASVGYRPLSPYAPTSLWGTPEQFRLLVDRCHQAGIGVLMDWVPNCFSADPHGLALFDGNHLYEHADPTRRHEIGGSGLIYDFGQRQVANYLIANALFWLDQYHLDGVRIPTVEAMLYRDYGRSRGEWTPNQYGGNENLEAVEFLRRLNEHVYAQHPGVFTVAQENSAWQRVSHPTFVGGLGFGFRWNTAWVRDTLRFLSRNPIHRKYYHDELLRGPGSAFLENYVLPLSHEEVSIGRGPILRRMPGDRWQRFANLRTCYALLFGHPGKKLLFMGTEFAQDREWNSEISLDWHLLEDPMHRGVQQLVRDLNAVYRTTPALYEKDCDPEGFEWIDCNDSDQSVISFLRKSKDGTNNIAVVCNFTPVVRPQYQLGVPAGGFWQERLNTDAEAYCGANVGNAGGVYASQQGMHGRPYSLTIVLPPFAAVLLEHKGTRLK